MGLTTGDVSGMAAPRPIGPRKGGKRRQHAEDDDWVWLGQPLSKVCCNARPINACLCVLTSQTPPGHAQEEVARRYPWRYVASHPSDGYRQPLDHSLPAQLVRVAVYA